MKILDDEVFSALEEIRLSRQRVRRVRDGLLKDFPHWNRFTDARGAFFARLEGTMTAVQASLLYIGGYLVNPQWWREHADGEAEAHRMTLVTYSEFCRRAYLSEVFNATEGAARRLAHHLYPDRPELLTDSASKVFNSLLGRTKPAFPEAFQLLTLLRLTRNVLHHSGVVRSPSGTDEVVRYRGVDHHFREGEFVEHANWSFLTHLAGDLAELMGDVMRHAPLSEPAHILDESVGVPEGSAG